MDEDEEMIQSDTDPLIKYLNTLWDIRFEQREPPTKDKVAQVNLGNKATPKPLFISESLSPSEKEDLISLVLEYIDVFAWNYEDMPGLVPQVAMHYLNINLTLKQSSISNDDSVQRLWKQSNRKSKKLIDSDFFREEQHPD